MQLQTEIVGNVAYLKVAGVLDIASSPNFRERMVDLRRHGVLGLVMNMAGLEYLDSAGLATLVDLLNMLEAVSGVMVVVGLSNAAREMFKIANLERLFVFAGDSDEAEGIIRSRLNHDT